MLCDRLEEKMKGTRVEGVVPRLFEGHTQAFIECVDVDFRSQRRESFQDLQLDVKGCATIYDSFDRYCEARARMRFCLFFNSVCIFFFHFKHRSNHHPPTATATATATHPGRDARG